MKPLATKKPARHGLCRLTLRIDATDYVVLPVRDDRGQVHSFKLKKSEQVTHIIDTYGNCTCEDFCFVQRRLGGKCKHLKAMAAVGLR